VRFSEFEKRSSLNANLLPLLFGEALYILQEQSLIGITEVAELYTHKYVSDQGSQEDGI